MRKLNNTKEFILNNDTLLELCEDKKVRYLMQKMNYNTNFKLLSKQVRNLRRYIKRNYNCNQVSFDSEILEIKCFNNTTYKYIISLPIRCRCCGVINYKGNMHDNKICIECYNDVNSIPVCCRCGGYVGLECNCN